MNQPHFTPQRSKATSWCLAILVLSAPPLHAAGDGNFFGLRSQGFAPPSERAWSVHAYADADSDGIGDLLFVPNAYGSGRMFAGLALGRSVWGFDEPLLYELGGNKFFAERAVVARIPQHPDPVVVMRDGDGTFLLAYEHSTDFADPVWEDDYEYAGLDPGFGFNPNQAVMLAGDLDADGYDEFVMETDQDRFVIRWSSRNEFTRFQVFPTKGESYLLPIMDYNADGHADVLAVADGLGGLVLYPGTGTDELGDPIAIGVAFDDLFGMFIDWDHVTGQFDGVPGVDIAIANADTHQTMFVLNLGTPQGEILFKQTPGHEDAYVRAIGDVDGDGITDLAVPFAEGEFRSTNDLFAIWFNPLSEPANLSRAFSLPASNSNGVPLHTQDINGDGVRDIVGFAQGWLGICLEAGSSGNPEPRFTYLDAFTDSPRHGLDVDLDGDGNPEVLAGGNLSANIIDPLEPDGAPVGLDTGGAVFMSITIDIDGDGQPEVVTSLDTELIVYAIPGDGTLSEISRTPNPVEFSMLGLDTGEFNGLPGEDLLVSHSSPGWTGVYTSNGNGGLELYAELDAGYSPRATAGDFNGDGLDDIATGDDANDRVRVFLNQGDGTFIESASLSGATYWLNSGDLDEDGHIDLVAVGGNTGVLSGKPSLSVWFGDGAGSFEYAQAKQATVPWYEVLIEDLDGDGLAELIVCAMESLPSYGGGADASIVLSMTSPRTYDIVATVPNSPSVAITVADFNGDGSMDLGVYPTDKRMHIWWGPGQDCPSDLNHDGVLNFFDVVAFLSLYNSHDTAADLAEPFAVWNFFDVAAFVASFNKGCG